MEGLMPGTGTGQGCWKSEQGSKDAELPHPLQVGHSTARVFPDPELLNPVILRVFYVEGLVHHVIC